MVRRVVAFVDDLDLRAPFCGGTFEPLGHVGDLSVKIGDRSRARLRLDPHACTNHVCPTSTFDDSQVRRRLWPNPADLHPVDRRCCHLNRVDPLFRVLPGMRGLANNFDVELIVECGFVDEGPYGRAGIQHVAKIKAKFFNPERPRPLQSYLLCHAEEQADVAVLLARFPKRQTSLDRGSHTALIIRAENRIACRVEHAVPLLDDESPRRLNRIEVGGKENFGGIRFRSAHPSDQIVRVSANFCARVVFGDFKPQSQQVFLGVGNAVGLPQTRGVDSNEVQEKVNQPLFVYHSFESTKPERECEGLARFFQTMFGNAVPTDKPLLVRRQQRLRAKMRNVRMLLLGGHGMLGSDLALEFQERSWDVAAPAVQDLDITDPLVIAEWAAKGWDWIVNCAAYTAVDKAEQDKEEALTVNALGPGYIARSAAVHGVKFLHVSTDFVFDGKKGEPYVETDRPTPLGHYGYSKLLGEEAVLASGARSWIVRTSWLFGPNGGSFPRTILNAARAGKTLRVVADQIGTPTYTADLARVIADVMSLRTEPGIYHAAGPDIMSWHELADRTLKAAGLPTEIEAIRTEDWPTPAPRPAFSALSFDKCAAAGIAPMRNMDHAIPEFIRRLAAS